MGKKVYLVSGTQDGVTDSFGNSLTCVEHNLGVFDIKSDADSYVSELYAKGFCKELYGDGVMVKLHDFGVEEFNLGKRI